jgi:hypothetical protein
LAAEQGGGGPFVRVETADDLPEVLVDRQQVSEALATLLAATFERCGDPSHVRVRVMRTEAAAEKSAQTASAARIEILSPRALITEHDLGTSAEPKDRHSYRRADLTSAEKLLEANGGRLIPPSRDDEEQVLTVVLRAAAR